MAATEATYSFSSSSSAAGRRVSQRNSVASVGLKAKELEFVYETLSSYGDYEIVYSTWVKKINPKGKVQKRLLVLGPFHIFSFKMGTFGKKGLQRCGHYYELYELHAGKPDQLDIRFHSFNILFNSQEVGQIVRVIEGIYRGLHPDFPEHFTQQLIVNVDQKILIDPAPHEVERIVGRAGSFDNFWHIFCAWCNYYGIRDVKSSPETKDAAASIQFLPEFQRYLQKKFADKSHVLDNPPLQNAIHFKALCKALYFNRHFKHVSLTDYSVASADGSLIMAAKELLPPGMGDESIPKLPRSPRVEGALTEPWSKTLETQIVELLSHTSSLTHLTLSSLPLGESFFKKLSECLKKRRSSLPSSSVVASSVVSPRSSLGSSVSYSTLAPPALGELELEYFSLAGTKLDEKAWKHLGEILKIIGNHISHVDFSNCAITHKGIAYLSEALIFATGANLRYLNLSHNMLGLEGTTSLNHVISSGSCLYEINLANCALDIAEICKYVKNKGCGVRRLNVSHNPITEEQAEDLVSLGLFTTTLRHLDISYTGITAPKVAKFLTALHNNNDLTEPVDLDLSGNPALRPDIAPLISQLVIGGVNRLGGLVLDDCDLQDAGMQELFAALTALTPDLQLTSLSVSYNVTKSKGDEREKTATAIHQFLSKAGPSLRSFTLRGAARPPGRHHSAAALASSTSSSLPGEHSRGTLKRGSAADSATSRGSTLKKKDAAAVSVTSAATTTPLRFGPALGAALECLACADAAAPGLERLEVDGNEAGEEAARELVRVVEAHPKLVELGCDDNAIPLCVYDELLDKVVRAGLRLARLSVPVADGRRSKDREAAKRLVERVERFNRGERDAASSEQKAKSEKKEKKKKAKKNENESEEVAETAAVETKGKEKKSKKNKAREDEAKSEAKSEEPAEVTKATTKKTKTKNEEGEDKKKKQNEEAAISEGKQSDETTQSEGHANKVTEKKAKKSPKAKEPSTADVETTTPNDEEDVAERKRNENSEEENASGKKKKKKGHKQQQKKTADNEQK